MILLENGNVETEDEAPEIETPSDEGIEHPVQGQLLVNRRSMSLQTKPEEHEQRQNLFHTRCTVQGKICSLIIDGGSCTNAASEDMVRKLSLPVMDHPRPYPLQWLNDQGELKVTRQVKVPLSIGKYEDEVLCDVVPMDAGHILLGRPWQTDRRVIHDGFTNRHSFVFKGRKTTLVPMTPHEVYLDQMHLTQQKKDPGKSKAPKGKSNFLIKTGEVKRSLIARQSIITFGFQEACLSLTNPEPVRPSRMYSPLWRYKDVSFVGSPKESADLRANPFQVGGDDMILDPDGCPHRCMSGPTDGLTDDQEIVLKNKPRTSQKTAQDNPRTNLKAVPNNPRTNRALNQEVYQMTRPLNNQDVQPNHQPVNPISPTNGHPSNPTTNHPGSPTINQPGNSALDNPEPDPVTNQGFPTCLGRFT